MSSFSEKLMDKIKLDPETSALILIDLQHGIVALKTSPHPASSVVAKAASLAATFRKHSSPVIYVRVDLANMLQVHADRSHGDPKNPPPAIASELVSASGVQAGDLVVTKRHWSAFSGTDLEERLKQAGVKTVVIGGITTNYGVESTARAAAGFGVVFVEDATTSISAEAHQFAFETIFPMLGRVRQTSEVIEAFV
jgi:nicotinamidase-related amidase